MKKLKIASKGNLAWDNPVIVKKSAKNQEEETQIHIRI